jgi:ribosomal protein S18 acetylase RimI-like enzyme
MKIKLKDKLFDYRFAKKEDADIINKFDKIINNHKEDSKYYLRHNKKNILKTISEGNKIIVVFYNHKLVAWATLFLDIKEKHLLNWNLTLKNSKKSGILATAAVSKKYRGYGIQKFLIKKRIDYLKKKNMKFAFVGASPENEYSLNNIKSFGFKFIKKIVIKHPKIINKKQVMCDQVHYNYRLKL